MTNYQSPCIGVCFLLDDYCVGCYRTGFEIEKWGSYSAEEKSVTIWRANERRTKESGKKVRQYKTKNIPPTSKSSTRDK